MSSDLHDRAAEECLIGSMLYGGDAIDAAAKLLCAEDFYVVGYQALFRALVDMNARGSAIDLTLVAAELTERGELNRVEGALGLARLLERVPSGANVGAYAPIVVDRSQRRAAVLAAEKVTAAAIDVSRPLGDAGTDALRAVARPSGRLKVIARRASDVEARSINWLWAGRIPRGMLSLLVGPPKVAKSTLSADIVARTTRGNAWPDGAPNSAGPLTVLMANVEDPVAEVQRPRLEAAGADLERIMFVEGLGHAGSGSPLLLDGRGHLEALEEEILKHPEAGLVVLDPLSAFFGHTNTWRDTDVRRVLVALSQLAERLGVAILAVHHLNKRPRGDGSAAIDRVSGSGAFSAAARSVLLVARRPGEERSILTSLGGNLAGPLKGLAFVVADRTLQNGVNTSAIEWDPTPIDVDADQLLAPPMREQQEGRRQEVQEWLRDLLTSKGTVPATEVDSAAKLAGFSENHVKAARKALGVVAEKIDGGMRWGLRLTDGDPR